MVHVDLVRDLARRIDHVAALLVKCVAEEPSAIEADEDRRDLVSFRIYLGMQIAIDLASHVITDEGWGPATSLRDHFDILANRGVLDADLARDLAAGVKIRNLVGHAYGNIDGGKLHQVATVLPALLRRYAAVLLKHAETPPEANG